MSVVAAAVAAVDGGGIQAETIAAYCALAAAVLTPLFTAIAASRRQTVELEVPRLRQRVQDIEAERANDRRQYEDRINELEEEVTGLRLHVYNLEQTMAGQGMRPPPRPARLRVADKRRAED